MTYYRFTDHVGDILEVRPTPDPAARPDIAVIDCDPRGSVPGVFVPAHRLAEVVAAMYEAAGQEAPDLPVIADQADVKRLAQMIYDGTYGYPLKTVTEAAEDLARKLLERGVTVPPEVTP